MTLSSLQALQRAMIVAFGAFQDDQLTVRYSASNEKHRAYLGAMFCHSVAMAVVDRWSGVKQRHSRVN